MDINQLETVEDFKVFLKEAPVDLATKAIIVRAANISLAFGDRAYLGEVLLDKIKELGKENYQRQFVLLTEKVGEWRRRANG